MTVAPKELLERHYPSNNKWYTSVGNKSIDNFKEVGLDIKDVMGTDDPLEIGKTVKKWLVDYMTSGLQPSDLILIAARPSMGKTAFVLNMAQNICIKDKKGVAIFSLEMSREQLMNRLLALESHVDSKLIRNGRISAKDWEGIIEAASAIGESKMIIDDTPGISIRDLRTKCRKYKAENKRYYVKSYCKYQYVLITDRVDLDHLACRIRSMLDKLA